MLIFKKTAAMVLTLASSVAVAGAMGPVCTAGSVTVPCETNTWDFAATALYLQPEYSGHGYVGSTTAATASSNVENFISKTIDWNWGFKLEAGYHYAAGDINLNWYSYSQSNNQSLPNDTDVFDYLFGGNVLANYKTQWNAVNLEFGKEMDIGERSKVRFHGGAQYANLQEVHVNTGTSTVPGYTQFRKNDVTFNGIGPRLGVDYGFNWNNGFAVYANGGAALLVGTNHLNRVATINGAPSVFTTVNKGSATNTVPELEGKLGATYSYAIGQGLLSVNGGWMWVNYFSALMSSDMGYNGQTKESSLSFQGPYVGLKWSGNVA